MKCRLLLSCSIIIFSFSSCDIVVPNDTYIQYHDVKDGEWNYKDNITFNMEIKDTSSLYDLYVNLRHTGNYQFKNLWVLTHTTYPSGKTLTERKNLLLLDNDGRWFGNGVNNFFDVQISLQDSAKFPELGNYQIMLEQHMRLNPIKDIYSVGLKVIKL